MKRVISIAVLAASIAITWGAVTVRGQTKPSPGPSSAPSMKPVIWEAEKIQYKEVQPGIWQGILWGDPQKGAYGSLTKIVGGTQIPLHTHSCDLKAVVVMGKMTVGIDDQVWTVGTGSYLMIPAGTKHTTSVEAGQDCLFFDEGSGKFDTVLVDEKPAKK